MNKLVVVPGHVTSPGLGLCVNELRPVHFGHWITLTTRDLSGWLYVIRHEYNDGYPSTTLGLVINKEGDYVEEAFTDSDPAQHPKTLSDEVRVHENDPLSRTGKDHS